MKTQLKDHLKTIQIYYHIKLAFSSSRNMIFLQIISKIVFYYIQFPEMNVSRLLSYEAKLLFSEGGGRMQTCSHTLVLLQHEYHTSGLSKEVYYFVLSQGAQKLPAVKLQMSIFYTTFLSKSDFSFTLLDWTADIF